MNDVAYRFFFFFFFNDTATTEIYTLSLHDALPICADLDPPESEPEPGRREHLALVHSGGEARSEEHTSELQSRSDLVCRLLLEKKKNRKTRHQFSTMTSALLSIQRITTQ